MKWLGLVLMLALVVLGCTREVAPVPNAVAPAPTAIASPNTTLPNFVIRLSTGQGPTRTNITVVQGLRITFIALNNNFTIQSRELGINAMILQGHDATVSVAPPEPGTYRLHCTHGCPPGKDTITVTTYQPATT